MPFTLELADCLRVRVNHPEFMSHRPGARTDAVSIPEGYHKIIDVMLLVAIDFGGSKGRRRRAG